MSTRAKKHYGNPDFRASVNMPAPAIDEVENEIKRLLVPRLFAPLREGARVRTVLRDRVLTLPTMMAIVVSLVLRQVRSLSEIVRLLSSEGLLWVEPTTVSKQALSKRMVKLPAESFAVLLEEVIDQLPPPPKELAGMGDWNRVREHFGTVCLADGSTLEALHKKLKSLKDKPDTVLGGKMMMVVDAFTRAAVWVRYTNDVNINDMSFAEEVAESLPTGGLIVFDLGFFSFKFFDLLNTTGKFFGTRLREKTVYQVVDVLAATHYYKDEIIKLGHRSNPCQHRVRLVSVLWNGKWYRYLTNVLSPEVLSARQVCELYRRRWRIEEAFLLTKRLLGLSYLWVGASNGVAIQVYATWIFYAVLINLCVQVSQALNQPIERISVEMVFRSLYHFSRAQQLGRNPILIDFLTQSAQLFGLVKAIRNGHRLRDQQNTIVWAESLS